MSLFYINKHILNHIFNDINFNDQNENHLFDIFKYLKLYDIKSYYYLTKYPTKSFNTIEELNNIKNKIL